MGITSECLYYVLCRLIACAAVSGVAVFTGTTCSAQSSGECGAANGNSRDGMHPAAGASCLPNFAGQGFPSLGSFSAGGQPSSPPTPPYFDAQNGYMYPQVQWLTRPSICGPTADGLDSNGGSLMFDSGSDDSLNQASAYTVPHQCNPDFYNAAGYSATAYQASGCNSTGVNAASWSCRGLPIQRWYGGFEFQWMRAHFDQNVAMIIDPPIGNTLVPFDYDFKFTPRTWLGWQGTNGGGFRAIYWRFNDQAATEQATAVSGATPVYLFVYGAGGNLTRNAYADLGETLVANHSLTLQALDFEATQRFGLGPLQCLAGAGVRLADMDQHLRGEVYDATNALWEVVTNDLSFQGAGPTASLQAWRSLGASRFSTYGGLRGALLFCETQQAIYEMKDAYANELTDVANATEILSMGELSIGLQYNHNLGARAQFFVRGTYEAQAWFDVGGPVDSHSTVGLDGIGLATGLLY